MNQFDLDLLILIEFAQKIVELLAELQVRSLEGRKSANEPRRVGHGFLHAQHRVAVDSGITWCRFGVRHFIGGSDARMGGFVQLERRQVLWTGVGCTSGIVELAFGEDVVEFVKDVIDLRVQRIRAVLFDLLYEMVKIRVLQLDLDSFLGWLI